MTTMTKKLMFFIHIFQEVNSLLPEICKVAQDEYDQWDEENVDEYAGGGICHFIADRIVDVIYNHYLSKLDGKDFNITTVSSTHEQHVYVVMCAKDERNRESVYQIDIHHSWYEKGGGFSWTKIPDVEFTPHMVSISKIGRADEWSNYIDEF